MESKKCMWFMVAFYIQFLTSVVLSDKPDQVHCNPIEDYEETDPINRNLRPAFYSVRKCKGGIRLRKGYQCQATETSKLHLDLYNIHEKTYVTKIFLNSKMCKEVCVCGEKCHNPQKPICERGFRWDEKECRCVCDESTVSALQNKGKKDSVPLTFVAVVAGGFVIIFIVVLLLIWRYYRNRNSRRKHRYALLNKVQWNKTEKKKLKKYMDYVDAGNNQRRKKKSSIWCCSPDSEPTLLGNDQEDAGGTNIQRFADGKTADECFEIGYVAFKRDNYSHMLEWLKVAEDKLERGELPDRVNKREFTRDLYQYLSIAYLADKSWNIEQANSYKQKAIEKDQQRVNGEIDIENGNFEETTNANNKEN